MKKILEFCEFDSMVLESVSSAKEYLLKRYAEENDIKTSGIPEEKKKEILNNKNYIAIRDTVQKSPNYTLDFLRFNIEQGASLNTLRTIWNKMERYKQNLSKDLPMSIKEYADVIHDEKDVRPGWERLEDDLNRIPKKIKLRKLYDELIPSMKEEFNKATDDQIDTLIQISDLISKLPNTKNIEGNEVTAWREFFKGMKKYSDIITYPEYKSKSFAFSALISDAESFIDSYENTADSIRSKIEEIGNNGKIIYNKDGYLAVSARTPKCQRIVSGSAGYCINSAGTFWSYTEGRIQINVLNFNLPKSDSLYLLGLTLNKDGTIYSYADSRNNMPYGDNSGISYKKFMKELGYPDSVIDGIDKELWAEIDLKILIEDFLRKGLDFGSPEQIIKSICSKHRDSIGKGKTIEEWEKTIEGFSKAMFTDLGYKKNDIIDVFKENGILTESAFIVFGSTVKYDCSNDDLEEILRVTEEGFAEIEEIIQLNKDGDIDLTEKELSKFEETIKKKQEIIKALTNN